jgi:hypothetical protein
VTGYYEKKLFTMMLLHSENRNKRVTYTGNKKHDRSAVHNILNLEKKYHPVGAISKSNTKIIVTGGLFNFQLWRIYQWKKFCKSRIIDR